MALVTKSTPGRRKSLLALAAARRRNKRRIAEGLKPIVAGRQVSASSLSKHYGPGDHKSGSSQAAHGGQAAGVAPDTEDRQRLFQEWQRQNEERYRRSLQQDPMDWDQVIDPTRPGLSGRDFYRTDDLYGEAYPGAEADSDFFDPLVDTVTIPDPYEDEDPEQITFFADEIFPDDIVYGPTGPFRVEDIKGHYSPGVFRGIEGGIPFAPPPDLPEGMIRLIGTDADGLPVQLDLYRDQVAPPRITDHVVRQLQSMFSKGGPSLEGGFRKHGGPGNHKNGTPQSVHGNWVRGTGANQMLTRAEGSAKPRSGNRGLSKYIPTGDEPDSGYAVGMSERTATFGGKPSIRQVRHYVVRNWDLLSQPDYFLGFWESKTGEWYLDVSRLFDTADEAWEAYPNELAIFDFSTFESIDNPNLPASG